jgi:hypothetical protein
LLVEQRRISPRPTSPQLLVERRDDHGLIAARDQVRG